MAYARLGKAVAAGELPEAEYRFLLRSDVVTPRVQGASLTPAQEKVLNLIILGCTFTPEVRRVA